MYIAVVQTNYICGGEIDGRRKVEVRSNSR
jgi:hypothetical protein